MFVVRISVVDCEKNEQNTRIIINFYRHIYIIQKSEPAVVADKVRAHRNKLYKKY